MVPLIAFVKRALREHSRSMAFVFARAGLALALLICLVIYGQDWNVLGAAGLEFFQAILMVNVIFITVGGCAAFSSTIAEEKEDGTLSLLRMTDISPLAILFGKGGARLLDGLLLLAVQLPFMLIGVTLGGITKIQVLSAYAALGACLILIAGIGLLAGVMVRRPFKAGLLAGVVTWGVLKLGHLLAQLFGSTVFGGWESLDIFARLQVIGSMNFDGPIFSIQIWGSLAVGVGCFLTAGGVFDHFCSESRLGESERVGVRPLRPASDVRAPAFSFLTWKDTYFLHGGRQLTRWKTLGYGLLALWLASSLRLSSLGNWLMEWGARVLYCGVAAVLIETVIAASRMLLVERKEQTLGALFLVPKMSGVTLLAQKRSALWSVLKPVIRFLIFGWLLVIAGLLLDRISAGPLLAIPVIAFFAFIIVMTNALCLERLVIYLSLKLRTGVIPAAVALWMLGLAVIWGLTAVTVRGPSPAVAFVGAMLVSWLPTGIAAGILGRINPRLVEKAAEEE